MTNLSYALRLLRTRATFQSKSCPFCGSPDTRRLARKMVLSELRRCNDCKLQFRYPKDSAEHNADYYQSEYLEWSLEKAEAFRTADDPTTLVDDQFAVGRQRRIDLAQNIKSTGRVLDYGCSWGLGGDLLSKAGFEVCGFEVSRPRAEFARERYGFEVLTDPNSLASLPAKSFDLIYSSHVLEHITDIGSVLRLFRRLIKDDGAAVFFVPNCDGEQARTMGVKWGPLISKEHCLALDAAFFANALPRTGFEASFRSEPYDDVETPDPKLNLLGNELMVIARPD